MLFPSQTASQEAVDVAKAIKSHGMKASIAISPQTPAENITDELGQAVDMVLVMTVHPGKGGQKFIEECMSKVRPTSICLITSS